MTSFNDPYIATFLCLNSDAIAIHVISILLPVVVPAKEPPPTISGSFRPTTRNRDGGS